MSDKEMTIEEETVEEKKEDVPEEVKLKEEPEDIEIIDEDEEEVEIIDEEEEELEIVDEEDDDDDAYKVKMKPELSDEEKSDLNLRLNKNMARPKFRRQEWFRYKKLGDSWRKARGMHSKTRMNWKYRPSQPSVGFRGPKSVRHRHPSGFEDVLVHNLKELEALDPKSQAARIAHTVGTRKRVAIEKRAKELDIRILNRGS